MACRPPSPKAQPLRWWPTRYRRQPRRAPCLYSALSGGDGASGEPAGRGAVRAGFPLGVCLWRVDGVCGLRCHPVPAPVSARRCDGRLPRLRAWRIRDSVRGRFFLAPKRQGFPGQAVTERLQRLEGRNRTFRRECANGITTPNNSFSLSNNPLPCGLGVVRACGRVSRTVRAVRRSAWWGFRR